MSTNNTKKDSLNTQIGGNHYLKLKMQPIDFIVKNNIPFIEANIIKYISRYGNKNGIEDLKKIKHYIELSKQLSIKDYSKFVILDEIRKESIKHLINNATEYCDINKFSEKQKFIILKTCLSILDIENKFILYKSIDIVVNNLIEEYKEK